MRPRRAEAAWNPTALRAGTCTFSLVRGLVASQAARSRTSKVPKPLIWMRSPLARRSLSASTTARDGLFRLGFAQPGPSCDLVDELRSTDSVRHTHLRAKDGSNCRMCANGRQPLYVLACIVDSLGSSEPSFIGRARVHWHLVYYFLTS